MAFKLTYATMYNPPDELHANFDASLAVLKGKLGAEYAMLIDGRLGAVRVFSWHLVPHRATADARLSMRLSAFNSGAAQSRCILDW